MLEVFDDQTVGVAQSGARADWSRPPLLHDFGVGGDLPRDRLVEIGVENGDGGLCSETVLFGVELKDEKRSDGDDVQVGLRNVHIHVQPRLGQLFVEAHGVDQLPGFAEHSGEDPRSGEVGGVGVLSVDAGHRVRLPPNRGISLEYGAEIGRAIVNFDGPIVFCVVSRYHGGAFVVFSGTLNDNMEVIAIEGSYASVIGGAPAAATVFASEVNTRTDADPRVVELKARLDGAEGDERASLRVALADLRASVRSNKLGEVAAEFDRVHTVERALRVGSIDAIIPAARLRPHLIEAIERGMQQTMERHLQEADRD
jgi:hypothetical protein